MNGPSAVLLAWASLLTSIATFRYYLYMTMLADPGERMALAPAAALFRSMGEPARLAIVQRLASAEARVTDLVAELGLAQSTVSAHLACLRDCGLVTSRPVGRASLFRLACPELLDLLSAAETVLAKTGNAVALCPAYGLTGNAGSRRSKASAHPGLQDGTSGA